MINKNLAIAPYTLGEYERLAKLVDAIVEYETGEENSFYSPPHGEETRKVDIDVMGKNPDFYAINDLDPTMEPRLERIAEIMRMIVWRRVPA